MTIHNPHFIVMCFRGRQQIPTKEWFSGNYSGRFMGLSWVRFPVEKFKC